MGRVTHVSLHTPGPGPALDRGPTYRMAGGDGLRGPAYSPGSGPTRARGQDSRLVLLGSAMRAHRCDVNTPPKNTTHWIIMFQDGPKEHTDLRIVGFRLECVGVLSNHGSVCVLVCCQMVVSCMCWYIVKSWSRVCVLSKRGIMCVLVCVATVSGGPLAVCVINGRGRGGVNDLQSRFICSVMNRRAPLKVMVR